MTKDLFYKFYYFLQEKIKDTEYAGHVYLSGECVRDFLLGKNDISKIDLTVDIENGGIVFAEWLTKNENCYIKAKNPVNIVTNQKAYFKITSNEELKNLFISCAQTKLNPSYAIVEGTSNYGTLIDDCVLKDISVNALYLDVACGEIIDPTNAVDDMKEMIISTPNNPDITFKDEPLNMLKVIRYASQWQWEIDKRTWFGILKNHELIKKVSLDRVKNELNYILLSNEPSYGLERLLTSGLLYDICPQLYSLNQVIDKDKTIFKHTLDVVDGVKPNIVTRLTALLHDIGKPLSLYKENFVGYEMKSKNMSENIMNLFNYDKKIQDKVIKLIKYQRCFSNYKLDVIPKDNVLRKFIKYMDEDLDYAIDFLKSDMGAENNKKLMYMELVHQNINRIIKLDSEPEIILPITPTMLMSELNIKSGPAVGLLMAKIKESCKDNPNLTKEEALKIATEQLALIV